MSEDEQEARSFRYIMPRIMRLSSGRFALFIGADPMILEPSQLAEWIPDGETLESLQPKPQARPGRIRDLNLADLGL